MANLVLDAAYTSLPTWRVAAELGDGKRADDVHVVDEPDVLERRSDPRVLAEVIDDVRRLGNERRDVLGVPATILDARERDSPCARRSSCRAR